HKLSYNSLDCQIKLHRHMYMKYPDFKLIGSIQLGRTKAEAIVKKVLGPKALQEVLEDLQSSKFFAVQTDVSNIKNRKYFPTTVQYYNPKVGVMNKLIDFNENPDETAWGISNSLIQIFDKSKLSFNNVSCLSADNCNANFGINNSLFTQLKNKNNSMFKANSHAHIIHNTVKYSIDKLSVDVENIVLKIYSHFSQSAKRRETLKEFFEFVDLHFEELLHHVSTCWLSLNPCIGRILKNWPALIAYFND
ncbi:hypothetical protein EAG_02387, partial [Camponotus floridanus]